MSDKARSYFNDRWERLFRFDRTRSYRILEMAQYTTLYFVAALIFGSLIDQLFPRFDAEKSTRRIAFEMLMQTILIVVVAFYLRKLVKLVPFFLMDTEGYSVGTVPVYDGGLVMSFIFVAVQYNFIQKLGYLGRQADTYLSKVFHGNLEGFDDDDDEKPKKGKKKTQEDVEDGAEDAEYEDAEAFQPASYRGGRRFSSQGPDGRYY